MTNQTNGQGKKEKRTDALTKAAAVFCWLLEIIYCIGAAGMLLGLVLFALIPLAPDSQMFEVMAGDEMTVQGFSIVISNSDGQIIRPSVLIFFSTAAVTLALMAWIFRSVNLILRTAQSKNPFQKENVRRIRKIGIFFLGIASVQLTASDLAVLFLGPEVAEIGVNMGSVVTGILMLCLAQAFTLGVQMQDDIDGLV